MCLAHRPPPGHRPPSLQNGMVPPQASAIVEVTVVVVVVVVLVVGTTHPPAPHASQQLANTPTHALPPSGAVHRPGSRFVLHRGLPPGRVRQQVTAPGLPHVERAAQRLTAPLQDIGSVPAVARALAIPAAHATYVPCGTVSLHVQSAATWMRASATACASPGMSPHRANAVLATRDTPSSRAVETRSVAVPKRCRAAI